MSDPTSELTRDRGDARPGSRGPILWSTVQTLAWRVGLVAVFGAVQWLAMAVRPRLAYERQSSLPPLAGLDRFQQPVRPAQCPADRIVAHAAIPRSLRCVHDEVGDVRKLSAV